MTEKDALMHGIARTLVNADVDIAVDKDNWFNIRHDEKLTIITLIGCDHQEIDLIFDVSGSLVYYE